MAEITAHISRDLDWRPEDRLQLLVGSPDAASLAASNPAGGTVALEMSPWPAGAGLGGFGVGQLGDGLLGLSADAYGFGEGELGEGVLGINLASRAVMAIEYRPTSGKRSSELPIGVRMRSGAGDESSVLEEVVQLADPPVGARDLTAAAIDGSPGSVRLSWTESPDV